jgi:eukaryotic-like serine/threonine-protein kinase
VYVVRYWLLDAKGYTRKSQKLAREARRDTLATISFPSVTPPPDLFASDAESTLAAEPEELAVGFALNNYVIEACIGRGAMGVVYRARHSLLKKQVALKVMSTTLLTSTEARQRFFREAQAAAAIKHAHVVDIIDVGVARGTPYLVMELLDGIDLEKQLEDQPPLTSSELVALALPLIAALSAAHEAGVVHRDLKPGNIFLARGRDGIAIPKLLDFGVSKFSGVKAEDLTMTPLDQLLGSPLYLPPEALQGARELTALSDQYSLAVVLYECITGKPPFECESLLTLLNAIAAGDFVSPRQIMPETSLAVERTILRAMSADPGQRFGHINQMGQALLVDADLRTQALWNPSFGLPPPTLAAPMEPAPPPAASTDRASAPGPEPQVAIVVSEAAPFPWLSAEKKRRNKLVLPLALAFVGMLGLWVALGPSDPRAPTAQRSAQSAAGTEAAKPATSDVAAGVPRAPTAALAASALIPTTGAAEEKARDATSAPRSGETPSQVDTPSTRSLPRARKATPGSARSAQRSSASPRVGKVSRAESDKELRQLFFPPAADDKGAAARRPASGDPTPVVNEAPIYD